MPIWKAALFGLIQGITSILPVSSSGHVALFGRILGENGANSLSFMSILHIGTLLALIVTFRTDLIRVIVSFLRVMRDLILDLPVLLNHMQDPKKGSYRAYLSGNYRRFAVLLLTALLPTLIIGLIVRRFAVAGASNLLLCAMGFFVTALLLLVSSFSTSVKRSPKTTRFFDALLIGAFQGFSVFPGMSRMGLTLSATGLCSMAGSYRLRWAALLGIPTILGSLLFVAPYTAAKSTDPVGTIAMLVGVICSFLGSMLVLTLWKRFLYRSTFRGFAVYTLIAGVVCILLNFH